MTNTSSHEKINFEDLFHKWNRKVYYYALKKTSSAYIAEETVQRVFIKLWKNCAYKNIPIKIEAQLFCITRTILLDILKEENRRIEYVNQIESSDYDKITPYDIIQLKDSKNQLMLLIEKMPPMRKYVFMLSRFEQLSYKEIAERLSISHKTVENHINASLKVIKKAFSYIKIIIIFFH